MRVLCVAAHPDDEALGCGATLAKHVLAGDEVRILILGGGRPGSEAANVQAANGAAKALGACVLTSDLPDNRMDTVPLEHIARLIERVQADFPAEVVYTHHVGDLNIDHRRTHEAVLAACRPLPGCSVKRILAFEVPSATEWGLSPFRPTVYVDVAGTWERKAVALAHYGAEMRCPPHPRSYANVLALAHWRGAAAGLACVEAFELVRGIE